jgi:peroxiredoxin
MPTLATRREVMIAAASAAAAAGLNAATPTRSAASVRTGAPAPDFTATDSKGGRQTLAGHRGRILVLEWTNHECPYTVKHYATGNMQALQQAAADMGAAWLTVISSRPGSQGHVSPAEADRLTEERGARPTAVVLDPTGELGRLYGARTTPHMFVVDRNGTLAYMGSIDDQPTSNHASIRVARNYVREALSALSAGRPVAVTSTRSYGCSVKY